MVTSATGTWKIDPRGIKYNDAFTLAETRYSLPSGLLKRMAYQESRFNQSARSPAGALGIMQFMPATAQTYGIDPFDALASIDAAGRMMRDLYRQFGNWTDALAAYNWGSGNLASFRAGKINPKTGKPYVMPLETVAYSRMAADVGVA